MMKVEPFQVGAHRRVFPVLGHLPTDGPVSQRPLRTLDSSEPAGERHGAVTGCQPSLLNREATRLVHAREHHAVDLIVQPREHVLQEDLAGNRLQELAEPGDFTIDAEARAVDTRERDRVLRRKALDHAQLYIPRQRLKPCRAAVDVHGGGHAWGGWK